MVAFWWTAFAVAVVSLVMVYVWRPLIQWRRRYRVKSVSGAAAGTWELVLAPDAAARFAYRAGQFAWLKLGSPRPLYENPFSLSSAPAEGDELRFLIKEAGDFTGGIGRVAPGTPAFLDGPHGHFTLEDNGSEGIVLIAGGIGIAPMLSLLRQLAATNDPRRVILIYGNRVREQMVDVEGLAGTARLRDFTFHPVLTDLRGIAGEALDAHLLLGREIRFDLCRIVVAVACEHRANLALDLAASRSNSARVLLRALLVLLGSSTPSMANISRPIKPCASHRNSTCMNTLAISAPSARMKPAIVVKCGALSPDKAMNTTFSRQACSIGRLPTIPRE
jgi:NAD(P)H-flavin reductase